MKFYRNIFSNGERLARILLVCSSFLSLLVSAPDVKDIAGKWNAIGLKCGANELESLRAHETLEISSDLVEYETDFQKVFSDCGIVRTTF